MSRYPISLIKSKIKLWGKKSFRTYSYEMGRPSLFKYAMIGLLASAYLGQFIRRCSVDSSVWQSWQVGHGSLGIIWPLLNWQLSNLNLANMISSCLFFLCEDDQSLSTGLILYSLVSFGYSLIRSQCLCHDILMWFFTLILKSL